MQDILRKRSFWVALILILLLVGLSAGYLIKKERVEPLVSREEVEEVEEEALLREEAEGARVPVRAVAVRAICPTIELVSPRDRILLVDIDDSNPEKRGYQIRVIVKTDAEEGRAVFLRVNELGPISTAVKKGSAFFREVDLMEGPNTLVATVTSESGCLGESRPARVVVDTRAPLIKILSPGDGAIVNKTDLTVTGEARDEGRRVMFVTVNGVRAELKGERFKAILASQDPGPLEITANAVDMLGKVGTHTIRVTISLDKPFINITSPRKGERLSTPSLEVNGDFGNFSHPERVKITVNARPAEIDLRNSEYSLTLTDLSDGSLKITAIATDGVITAKAITDIILDTQPPSIRIDTPLNNEIYNVPAIVVRGSVNDPRPGSGIESVTVNGYEATVFEGSFSSTLSSLGPCFLELEITAEAEDNAGNLAASETVIITVDTGLPVVNVTYPERQSCLNTPEIEVSGVAAETCSGINWVEVNGIPAAIEGGIFSAVLPGGACIDPLTITAVAADWAGNRSSSEPVEVTVDSEVPEVRIDSPLEEETISDSEMVRGRAWDACSGVDSVMVNGRVAPYIPATESFSIELTGLREGNLELEALATDRCGNLGSYSLIVPVITGAPALTVIAPEDGQVFNTPAIPINGSFRNFPQPDAVTVTAVVEGCPEIVLRKNGELFDGIYPVCNEGRSLAIRVTATDGSSNPSDTVRITVDQSDPVVEVTSPLPEGVVQCLSFVVNGRAFDAISGVASVTVNGVAASGPPFDPGINGSWTATLENQLTGCGLAIQATAEDGAGRRSSGTSIPVQCLPVILPPCSATGIYCINDPANGRCCYDLINGTDCCNPNNEIDFGVPYEGMFGIGSALCFRPGDKITLPINANSGDDILFAWHIKLAYDKEVLINPSASLSDSCLPDPYYPAGGETARTFNFRLDTPWPVLMLTNHAGSREPTGRRNLVNLTFTISRSAEPGVYPITMEIKYFSAQEGVILTEGGPSLQTYELVMNPCFGEVVVVP
jgi:hypothetical protein